MQSRLVCLLRAKVWNALSVSDPQMEVGLNTELCHIIGHSLGAHLAGYAGYHLRTDFRLKLGRITGTECC